MDELYHQNKESQIDKKFELVQGDSVLYLWIDECLKTVLIKFERTKADLVNKYLVI